jgi:molybdopterin synthase catalytic subunit
VRGVLGTSYVSDTTRLARARSWRSCRRSRAGAWRPDEALRAGVFELCAEALDPAAAQRASSTLAAARWSSSRATRRDRNRARDVVRLDYEAFPAMAELEMAHIFEDCRARIAGDAGHALRMLVQHRTGTVPVGEPAVVVAVACAHRDAAFQAARFLIDELKARVPIWKKEVYADGHHWIGERP